MLKKSIIFSLFYLVFIILFPFKNNFVVEEIKETNNDQYIGYLIIPSIDMNLGFYDIDNEMNDVEKNIEILKTSREGSLYIAGHSGVGKKAYFNDLAKVKLNDEVIINYQNIDYKYLVTDIYNEKKDGDIKVQKKSNEKILILTTCDQIKKGYQLVIKAVLQ